MNLIKAGRSAYIIYYMVMMLGLGCMALGAASSIRNSNFEAYVRKHYTEALKQMERHQIPASIKMAQGLLETGAGQSTLAREHHNHFGIKCHRSWQGKRTFRTDDLPDECFRSYRSWQESYEDHSQFLKAPRYRRLFTLRYDDYQGWARGLQQAGYATNKGYANKLIKIIDDYELYALDRGRLPSWMRNETTNTSSKANRRAKKEVSYDKPMRPSYVSYGLLYVLADQGDSFDKVAEDMGISAKKLARYNDVPLDYPLQEGEVVYLQNKHRKATAEHPTHIVRIGDSMHSIAQLYGIKLKSLYNLNDKDEDYVPVEGEVLRLR